MKSIGSLPRSSSKELGLGGLTCLLRPICLGICALPSILEGCAWRNVKKRTYIRLGKGICDAFCRNER